jgi:outer membrane receptor protein involved in Fe transport
VAGVLYQNSRLYTNQYVVDQQLPALSLAAFGAPIEDVFGEGLVDGKYSFTVDQWAKDQQTALFGQVDYSFTSEWKGTLGVRIARTTLEYNRVYGGPLVCTVCNGSPETTAGETPNEHPVTPRIGISYEPTPQSLYYISAAKGSRVGGVNNPSIATGNAGCPGGLQVPTTFDSDSLWNYEIGAKNQWLDGRLRTQASVFYIDWKNVQQLVSSNSCFTASYKTNLGDANVSGFDFAAEYRVIDNLTLSVTGGYSLARYSTTALGPPNAAGDRDVIAYNGDSLGVSPWSATASGEYEFPAGSNKGYFRVDYTYTAKDTGEQGLLPRRLYLHREGHRRYSATGR